MWKKEIITKKLFKQKSVELQDIKIIVENENRATKLKLLKLLLQDMARQRRIENNIVMIKESSPTKW